MTGRKPSAASGFPPFAKSRRKGGLPATPPAAFAKSGRKGGLPTNSANKFIRRATILVAVVGVLLVAVGFAETREARFNRLGNKMVCRCGYCNQSLLDCNHVGCWFSEKVRHQLMAAVSGSSSDDLILQGFVQEYGAVVLAAPADKGFNRTAWIAPFAALGLGMLAVVYIVRRWRQQKPQAAAGGTPTGGSVELDSFREQARKETEL